MWVCLALFLSLKSVAGDAPPFEADAAPVYTTEVRGSLDAAVARHLSEFTAAAQAAGAQLAVVTLSSTGGDPAAAQEALHALQRAELPVAVYAGPGAARVEGPALLLLLGADVSAAAPAARLGPAPASALGMSQDQAVVLVRFLLEEKSRNGGWAERAVREGAVAGADEAYSMEVLDVVAEDEEDLMAQLDGGEVDKGAWTYDVDPLAAPRVSWPMRPSLRARHLLRSRPGAATAGLIGLAMLGWAAWALLRRKALVGSLAVMRADGRVALWGKSWPADGYGPFEPGEKVRVTDVEKGQLKIEKI